MLRKGLGYAWGTGGCGAGMRGLADTFIDPCPGRTMGINA